MSAITVEVPGALPCPFCGAEALHAEGDSADLAVWQIFCDNVSCEATGPCSATLDDAIRCWNHRVRQEAKYAAAAMPTNPPKHRIDAHGVALSPDGDGWHTLSMRLRFDADGVLPAEIADAAAAAIRAAMGKVRL